MYAEQRAVFDCNVYFQAILRKRGPAGECFERVATGQVRLFYADFVIDELLDITSRPKIRSKHPSLTDASVEGFIQEVVPMATRVSNVPPSFDLARDPDDARYVDLALVTRSVYVVTRDRDLLDLQRIDQPTGIDFQRRFPGLRMVDPIEFLAATRSAL